MKTKIMKLYIAVLSFYAIGAFAAPLITVDVVNVANLSNKADPNTGYGSVSYSYNIGKYDVTIAQYVTFLNTKAQLASDKVTELLWNSDMSDPKKKEKPGVLVKRSGSGTSSDPYIYTADMSSSWGAQSSQRPICWVSWFDAARFTNWLHNGADSNASTESGAYDLSGYKNKGVVYKNSNAKWWIPSEDEWYKSAYYDPTLNSNTGGYYNYPTKSNSVPHMGTPPGLPNTANFNNFYSKKGNALTPVGAYTNSQSYYGTYDQGGLLWQWTDGVYGPNRIIRGGSFSYGLTTPLKTIRRDYEPGFYEDDDTGFRVACDPNFCK